MSRRIVVVGNSGSGKTTLARQAAARLGVPHVELDALNHRAGWQEAPLEDFRAEVGRAIAQARSSHGGWVVDGNYRSRVADVLSDADTYVWLDLPRRRVIARVLRRTSGRLLLRRRLWNGNRERWRAVFSRNPLQSIVLWSWTQHDAYRRRFEAELADAPPGRWVRLRSPAQARDWLATLRR